VLGGPDGAATVEERVVTDRTVAHKAHVKPGTTIGMVNRVPGIVESLGLPNDVAFVRPAEAHLVFLFARTRAELEVKMPAAADRLSSSSALWVFFQKGSKQAGLDMSRNTVWAIAERLGMRPLGLVAVDDTWSVFRLKAAGPGGARTKGSVRGRRTKR
jgi:hypothetical protein